MDPDEDPVDPDLDPVDPYSDPVDPDSDPKHLYEGLLFSAHAVPGRWRCRGRRPSPPAPGVSCSSAGSPDRSPQIGIHNSRPYTRRGLCVKEIVPLVSKFK